MTRRLYYDDAYTTTFDAQIIARCAIEGQPGVVLDQTSFYPTSGGQIHDTGVLNKVGVINVVEEGDEIIHVLEHELPDDHVRGEIDWPRRYDHMQQHTGQHVLSETFISILDAHTLSFHMSDDISTIDLDRLPDSPVEWDAVEQQLQAIITANHPVTTYWVQPEQIKGLNLRKIPDRSGPLRIVDIDGIDRTACGGTHCRTTGELGMIQIPDRQPKRVHGGLYRLSFLCGQRARTDYQRRIAWMNTISSVLKVGELDVLPTITKWQDERKETERKIQDLTENLIGYEAEALSGDIQMVAGIPILTGTFTDRDSEAIRMLARQLVSRHSCVVLLGGGLDKLQLVFARSQDLSQPMGTLMQKTMKQIGGRGGGRPEMAMGSAPDMETVNLAITWAKEALAVPL